MRLVFLLLALTGFTALAVIDLAAGNVRVGLAAL